MPSLVKKWQSIQKELDEEEKSSSSDEDREQLNKKSIEDWKQQQLVTYVFMWSHPFIWILPFISNSDLTFLVVVMFFVFILQGKGFEECQL